MDETPTSSSWPTLRLRTRLASGLVALIPIVVTIAVLRFVFNVTAGILLPLVEPIVGTWPAAAQAALSLAILVAAVYLLGEVATNFVGRRAIGLGEAVVLRVPFVKTIYSISKRVVGALQRSESHAFRSVVFIAFPGPHLRAVGFVTSTLQDADGSEWNTVFVPTTPNPTTGFLQVVRREDLEETGLSVEEGIQMVMSLGVMAPGDVLPLGA